MELYKNTEDAFINYLKRHGYPDESILLEWGTPKCAIDIAVLADDRVTPIAIFEIKGKKTPNTIRTGIAHLKRAANAFDITAPCSLVFGTDSALGFEVVDVTEYVYNSDEVDISDIMAPNPLREPVSYNNLQAGSTSKNISRSIKKKQEKIDHIKWFCWLIFPLIALALLLLDAFGVYQITTLRLTVVGAAAILVLIPFFSEVSLKDFTFKRKGGK